MMGDDNWFYSDADAHTVNRPDELLGIYHYSVGRGANIRVNIGHEAIASFPLARAIGVRVEVLASRREARLKHVSLHCTARSDADG